jgi:transcriptional regulator with PAS, ATPase and Fis domain
MIIWSDILEPIKTNITVDSTVNEALSKIKLSQDKIGFVYQDESIIGYINYDSIMDQLLSNKDGNKYLVYYKDILKVPSHSPVEFYHNISLIVGINEDDKVMGYITTQEANNKLNKMRLTQMNHILNSSNVGILTMDKEYKITFVNESAQHIMGLSSHFLLYRDFVDLIECDKEINTVLDGVQLFNVEATINYKKMSGNFSPLYHNNEVVGLIYIFFLKQKFEETIQEAEFVRNLLEDLEVLHSISNEQITVVNPEGTIIRVTGTYLKDFWTFESDSVLIGKNIFELESKLFFKPNIFKLSLDKASKVSGIQEGKNGTKIWSVATPIFRDKELVKVIIVSRDITEIDELRSQLEKGSTGFRQQQPNASLEKLNKKIIYRSKIMENLVDEIKQIASADSTVMLKGESGVGKEVFAHAIHEYSSRNNKPLISVNCGAIPESLIESELFGYEKGSFTGADTKGKPGLFEMANSGTIFLDEIAELPMEMQVKLLRVIQEKEIMRIGSIKTTKIDVRVIAATNKNLLEMVRQSRFREDLYYRLNVIPIEIPPLRKRVEDIAFLILHFLQQYNETYQKGKMISNEAIDIMQHYEWPGNVRELQNIIERLYVTTKEDIIMDRHVFSVLHSHSPETLDRLQPILPLKQAIEDFEQRLIEAALKKYKTATKAAEVLEISPATISRKINKLISK